MDGRWNGGVERAHVGRKGKWLIVIHSVFESQPQSDKGVPELWLKKQRRFPPTCQVSGPPTPPFNLGLINATRKVPLECQLPATSDTQHPQPECSHCHNNSTSCYLPPEDGFGEIERLSRLELELLGRAMW